MILGTKEIAESDKVRRLNLINGLTGIKPGNLVGTRSPEGQSNLAIISSVVHLGSNPALFGFILRPKGEVRRHTHENILSGGYYSINHVPASMLQQAHYTSAKFPEEVSEFERCGFTEQYHEGFPAPFVEESAIKIGLRFLEEIAVRANNTSLIIGEIVHVEIPDAALDNNWQLNLETAGSIGISGLNAYYSLQKQAEFPYARPHETPSFNHEKAASTH